jgi:hypothetical protein
VVALGREGKRCAEIDAQKNLYTAAIAAKLQTDQGKAASRRRKWIAAPPNSWIKSSRARVLPIQPARTAPRAGPSPSWCAWR